MIANSTQLAEGSGKRRSGACPRLKKGDITAFEQLVSDTAADFSESLRPSRATGEIPKTRSKKPC